VVGGEQDVGDRAVVEEGRVGDGDEHRRVGQHPLQGGVELALVVELFEHRAQAFVAGAGHQALAELAARGW
jgi:hypothetical protein